LRIVINVERGMRWTRTRRPTSDAGFADGEAVWFWHPDADAKLATMVRIVLATVATKPVTGKSAE
jgi:hypothetical protein